MNWAALMKNDPTFCVPTESVSKAAEIMRTEGLDSIPVCESVQTSRVVGLITEHAIFLAVVAERRDAEKTRILDTMIREPVECLPDDDAQRALALMQVYRLTSVPIVDRDGRLLGTVDERDLRCVNAGSGAGIPQGFLGF